MSALYVFLMNRLILRHLIALIYPVHCPICSKIIGVNESFCNECENELIKYTGDFIIPKAEKFISAFEYNNKIAPAVFIMKDGISGNAPYAFGKAISECIKQENMNIDFIIPVPMFRENLKKRGFNQAELIAKEVGFLLNISVFNYLIKKNRKTPAQKNLTKIQRQNNLKNAFSVTDKTAVKNKNILIIDDVCTTGSTLSEITNLLIDSGASEVYCACACKTSDLKKR